MTDPTLPPDAQTSLLAWFDRARRDLPWRADRDPYRVWVSEVMLQQTQVATVVPFFGRFLAAFPTVAALAAADEQAVFRQWEGLGYYRRARHLHQAARRLVTDHAGILPNDPAVWGDLPGVGRYILGAVLSQAFDRRLPVVEANTRRVLARLFGYRGDVTASAGQAWLWKAAEAILPAARPGDFNQAMMELGALVCTPTAPKCDECPLAGVCVARRDGTQAAIPTKAARPAPTDVEEVAIVVRRGGRVLLAQRPANAGRWAGMWEFPHAERQPGESEEVAAGRVLADLTGLSATLGASLPTIRHGVTRFRIRMVCREMEWTVGEFASPFYARGEWVEPARLGDYPVSSPQRRLAGSLARPRQGELF